MTQELYSPEIYEDEEGREYIFDDQGEPYAVLPDGTLMDAEEDVFQVTDQGELLQLDPDEVEAQQYEGAWTEWVGHQLQALDGELGRRLTGKEIDTLYEKATSHHAERPDIGEIFDKEFAGRRNGTDSHAKQELIAEIAQDHMDQGDSDDDDDDIEGEDE